MQYRLLLVVFTISTTHVFSQSDFVIFRNQIIVSQKGIGSLPFNQSPSDKTLSANSTVTPLVKPLEPLSESELRAISKAAGIYAPANLGVSCLPKQNNCNPSAGTSEQINLRDVGPAGNASRVIEVTSTVSEAFDRTIAAINALPKYEAVPNYWRRSTQ